MGNISFIFVLGLAFLMGSISSAMFLPRDSAKVYSALTALVAIGLFLAQIAYTFLAALDFLVANWK